MGSLFGVPVRELTAPRIDSWLDEMKNPNHKWIHSKKRKRFKNELKLLSTILGYYEEYYEDAGFRFPIKRRHYEDADLNRQVRVSKDLSLEEFMLFRETLRKTPHGNVLMALATVQYFQAQRISETAGLYWEDINLDEEKLSNSRLTVRRIIVWPRVRTTPSYIKDGFKNADANEGIKEQPLFPEAYQALMELYEENKKGLVFQIDGRHIEYRLIQFWYDKSFKMAGLPYRGTHIMRHGGCPENVEDVVMDLSQGYRQLAKALFPNARITADKFHVLRLLVPAINRRRKRIAGDKRRNPIGRLLLRSKYALPVSQRWMIYRFLEPHRELQALYQFKERLHGLYRTRGFERASQALDSILEDLRQYDQDPDLRRLWYTLCRWRTEILNYFQTGLTNGHDRGLQQQSKACQKDGLWISKQRKLQTQTSKCLFRLA